MKLKSLVVACFALALVPSALAKPKSKMQTYTQTPDQVFKAALHVVETKYVVTLIDAKQHMVSFTEPPHFGNGMVTWKCSAFVFTNEDNQTTLSFTGMGKEGIVAPPPRSDFERAAASFGSLSGPSDDNPRKAFYKDVDKYLASIK